MAEGSESDPLYKCLQLLKSSTAQPDLFLSVQDGLAADFTSLTKDLYDLHKAEKLDVWKGSPLEQLVVKNFDEEQIWQELELQNSAVLAQFENVVDVAIGDDALTLLEDSEDEDEEEDEEEEGGESGTDDENEEDEVEEDEEDDDKEEKENRLKLKSANDEELYDEDSDIDFDVDELEKESKQKKKPGTKSQKPRTVSEVDDRFFKLSDMETFLDDMDKMEGKASAGEEIDYFQDLPSDEEEELTFDKPAASKAKKSKSSRNIKYKDYFVDEESEEQDPDKNEESEPDFEEEEEEDEEDYEDADDGEDFEDDDPEGQTARDALRKVTFDLPSDSEGEDVEEILGGKAKNVGKPESKSAFEIRQEKMAEKISELEKAALTEKPWQLTGEVTAQTRPENSMLEEDVDFDQASRMAPAVTEETTLQLEEIIIQRIKDQAWDDVVRKEKPKEEVFEYKKRLTLDHEKSKLSLAEVYEQEYIKKTQEKKTEEEENPAHVEIQKLMDTLFLKLDALSNFHFTPKPHIPEVKVISNLPSITIEEVAPVSVSDGTLLAPEEIKGKNKAGDVLGDSEKTATDKKRDRRKKKKIKRLKIQEKEKKKKLKEAANDGKMNKKSKAQVQETLKNLTKGGKAKVLTDDGMDKALRSSQAFFSQLQDQVKSQIKGSKHQAGKKKQKEVSASKLKL